MPPQAIPEPTLQQVKVDAVDDNDPSHLKRLKRTAQVLTNALVDMQTKMQEAIRGVNRTDADLRSEISNLRSENQALKSDMTTERQKLKTMFEEKIAKVEHLEQDLIALVQAYDDARKQVKRLEERISSQNLAEVLATLGVKK